MQRRSYWGLQIGVLPKVALEHRICDDARRLVQSQSSVTQPMRLTSMKPRRWRLNAQLLRVEDRLIVRVAGLHLWSQPEQAAIFPIRYVVLALACEDIDVDAKLPVGNAVVPLVAIDLDIRASYREFRLNAREREMYSYPPLDFDLRGPDEVTDRIVENVAECDDLLLVVIIVRVAFWMDVPIPVLPTIESITVK